MAAVACLMQALALALYPMPFWSDGFQANFISSVWRWRLLKLTDRYITI
jgi:hypothetical protein